MLQTFIADSHRLPFVETSCGVLVINRSRQVLLGHVTDKVHWELPKGRQQVGESTLEAAQRELKEETGLQFDTRAFYDIGDFDYKPNKRLHLYKVYVRDGSIRPEALSCTSFFPLQPGRGPVVAMDKFCWSTRGEIPRYCLPRLAERLLSLEW